MAFAKIPAEDFKVIVRFDPDEFPVGKILNRGPIRQHLVFVCHRSYDLVHRFSFFDKTRISLNNRPDQVVVGVTSVNNSAYVRIPLNVLEYHGFWILVKKYGVTQPNKLSRQIPNLLLRIQSCESEPNLRV